MGNTAVLSGLELLAANPAGADNPTVDLEYSADGGTSWQPLASGLTMDRFGRGSYTWAMPMSLIPGDNYRLPRESRPGEPGSRRLGPGLSHCHAGNPLLRQRRDCDRRRLHHGDGNNAYSGKSPDRPMASLSALLSAYDLDAGDVIHVDTATYKLLDNLLLIEQDSGVRIEGPATATALINRDSPTNSSSCAAFELAGVDDVTLDHLWITGGYYGVYGARHRTASLDGVQQHDLRELPIRDASVSAQ